MPRITESKRLSTRDRALVDRLVFNAITKHVKTDAPMSPKDLANLFMEAVKFTDKVESPDQRLLEDYCDSLKGFELQIAKLEQDKKLQVAEIEKLQSRKNDRSQEVVELEHMTDGLLRGMETAKRWDALQHSLQNYQGKTLAYDPKHGTIRIPHVATVGFEREGKSVFAKPQKEKMTPMKKLAYGGIAAAALLIGVPYVISETGNQWSKAVATVMPADLTPAEKLELLEQREVKLATDLLSAQEEKAEIREDEAKRAVLEARIAAILEEASEVKILKGQLALND